ncbi:MAG: O-antigen biosynthesis protein [Solirubrobacteraceae bacterium]|nr:O-antigen biosynthesis protein [Solirubrobacteraceae bacterium]
MNPARRRYIWSILRRGPGEAAYALLRARRRRRNIADEQPALSPSDRLVVSGAFDATEPELAANAALLDAYRRADALDIGSIQWFIPWFHNPHGGGINTILRFGDHLLRAHGVESRFCVYDRTGAVAQDISAKIGRAFASLAQAQVTTARSTDAASSHLPPCDAAIATTWTSAFPVLRFAGTRAKFFFVQDFEPEFYPAGSASAVLEQAARFGLPGIVNTPGLADVYRSYGNEAISFLPAVDRDRFHPREGARGGGPVRIAFYGRPLTPRNAFGLGVAALRKLKRAHGDAIEIVSVGEDWHPGQYGVADVLRNAGALEDLDELAQLYRSCDIGLVFMLTKHPSYQPFEFMASGLATVSNENPHTGWFLRHEENALLAPPLPSLVAERLDRLVRDADLRARLAQAGSAEVAAVSWEDQIERVWGAMTKRGEPFTPESEISA